jgi:hypothetical protein
MYVHCNVTVYLEDERKGAIFVIVGYGMNILEGVERSRAEQSNQPVTQTNRKSSKKQVERRNKKPIKVTAV